jgi:dihydroorotate dehydrogenase
VGLAAGFDKDGHAIRGWAALGLGFAELGTVTPRPQPGNPRPRLFRLAEDEALVNRMGFNNHGAAALAARIRAARQAGLPAGFAIGVSIGPNRDTPADRVLDDYRAAFAAVAADADYVAVNISSPNTPSLRALEDAQQLMALVEALRLIDDRPPLLVKLSADLEDDRVREVVEGATAGGAAGFVLSNTTVRRSGLVSSAAGEAGGLSGRPLLDPMLARVAAVRRIVGGSALITGSGGVRDSRGARAALDAGADLLQVYTGLVYRGPRLIGELAALD